MAPEQARGKPVDRRADIWAFGCVLYEMLTGRRPFAGEDVSMTMSAVLQREPDWSTLPAGLPTGLTTYLRRCLEKEPRQRVRDIGDVRLALDGVFDSVDSAPTDATPPASRRVLVATAVATTVLAAAASGAAVWQLRRAAPPELTRMTVTTGNVVPRELALSPDGRTLVYVGLDEAGVRHLYQRPLDRFEATVIPGTDQALAPFFSPDGNEVGFAGPDGLRRVSLSGGTPVTIAPIGYRFRGGSWSRDGTIVFALEGSGLWRVPSGGGDAVQMTTFAEGETLHWAPEVVDDSQVVVFTARVERETDRLIAQRIDTGERFVLGDGAAALVTPGSRLAFIRDDDLWTAAFDAREPRLEMVQGPLLEGVVSPGANDLSGYLLAIAADTGTLAYVPSGFGENALVWFDRSGRTAPVNEATTTLRFSIPRLSPDGSKVAFTDGNASVWLVDLATGSRTRVGTGGYPTWTPDGTGITFARTPPDGNAIYRRAIDASTPAELIAEGYLTSISWAPDGRRLGVTAYPSNPDRAAVRSNRDVGVLNEDGSVDLLTSTDANERGPRFSPDGRWVAYVSDESGRDEVYVLPHPEPGVRTLVSNAGGDQPVWSPDGRELFYVQPEPRSLMAVPIAPAPSFGAGAPVSLFSGLFDTGLSIVGVASYDVHPQDGRFLMTVPTVGPGIYVVTNWLSELTPAN